MCLKKLIILFALGAVSNLYSGLGMNPWGVFHVGLSGSSELSLGQVTQLVGLVVLLLSWALGSPPGFGTVMNMFFIGFFIDLVISNGLIPKPVDIIWRAVMLGASIICIGSGSLFYMQVMLGAGPRDGLMVGLVRKLDKPIWMVRGSIEIFVLIIGWALGGPVGFGTVVTAITVGYSVQFAFKLGRFDPKSRQMNLWELYQYLFDDN